MKNLSKSTLIILITIFASSVFYLASGMNNSAKISENPDVIFLTKNHDQESILEKLEKDGYIKNKFTYYTIVALSKIFGEIETGGYVLSHNLGAASLYNSLKNPEYKYVSVIEGMRKEEIAERIGKVLKWDEEKISEFKNEYPLCEFAGREGYLAAGDYLISDDASIQSIQSEMEKRFAEKIEKAGIENTDDVFNTEQIITIASLIQREAAGARDMRLISGIIWNRLLVDMPLQIDATLQYAKGDDELWWPTVKPADKSIESPFNTYQNPGLPPAPIASPGLAALKAAADPVETDCLFYLHDKSKNIHCSPTYKGHLQNIERYLK